MSRRILRFEGYSGRVTQGFIDIEELDGPQRVRRAVRVLGGWWVAAAVCVFVPLAHFVLVPLCLLGGLVAAAVRLNARTRLAGAEGTCPDCGARQPLDLPRALRFPLDIACRDCHRAIRVAG